MQWNRKPKKDLTQWHIYFALLPKATETKIVWLETILRRIKYGYGDDYYWEYKTLE